jgi:hypothetical protein
MGVVVALATSSCYYDPNYMIGGSYGVGYGEGYGYGGSGFSSSLFISTGDPRWGYDPYCYSYYDYRRRCYYDPYLHGYYPMGYRPMGVAGVPHPYGYNRSYCPPPSRVTNITLTNYQNRERAYRNSNYSWAPQVRPYSGGPNRQTDVRHVAPYSRSQPALSQPAYPNSGRSNFSGYRGQVPPPGNPTGMRGTITPRDAGNTRYASSPIAPTVNSTAPPRSTSQIAPSPSLRTSAPRSSQPLAAPGMESRRPMPQSRPDSAVLPTYSQGRAAPPAASPSAAPPHRGSQGGQGGQGGRGGHGKDSGPGGQR